MLLQVDPQLSKSFARTLLNYRTTKSTTRQQEDGTTPLTNKLDEADTILACHTCGLILRPGEDQTRVRIRPLKRNRTKRRRASRAKSSDVLRAEQRRVKQRGLTHYDKKSCTNYLDWVQDFCRTNDGQTRNCAVYSCGACGDTLKFKGIPAAQKRLSPASANANANCNKDGNEAGSSIADSTWTLRSNSPMPMSSSTHSQKRQSFGVKTDFSASRSAPGRMSISPVPTLGKQRKRKSKGGSTKKKEQPKKSKLGDFFSSLNDF